MNPRESGITNISRTFVMTMSTRGEKSIPRKVAGESAQDYALTLDAAREDYARMWGDAPF